MYYVTDIHMDSASIESKSNNNKALGLDGIVLNILIIMKDVIAEYLRNLICNIFCDLVAIFIYIHV